MEDRRRYNRIKKCFMSWLKFLQNKRKQDIPPYPFDWDIVTTCDIGAGGIMFNYNMPVKIGTKIKLKVICPFREGLIECVGRVVRNEKVDNYKYCSLYRVAAEFERISVPNKDLIDKVANEMCA